MGLCVSSACRSITAVLVSTIVAVAAVAAIVAIAVVAIVVAAAAVVAVASSGRQQNLIQLERWMADEKSSIIE